MSEHGSNVSIEEIGPEEIENITVNEDAEVLIPEVSPVSAPASTVKEDDDPPLENLEPAQPSSSGESVAVAAATSGAAPDTLNSDKPSENVSEPASPPPPQAAAAPVEEVIEEVPRPPLQNPQQSMILSSRPTAVVEDDAEEDDDDIDETITERLIGLTEMFPDFVRNGTVGMVKNSWSASCYLYGFSRSAAWIFFSTASILFLPVMIETERLSIMDQQKQQKTQMLLGPGVASSGSPSLGPPPI
eukprot:TRINITY_DN36636_c0_g1_i1.p1 TRINITY_DN36636_c0_g1~~TRINITY_DN36636_c0_g1_i1.p1  ORF type:complete len:245 (-),score=50.62 TRINITY_DN36636_c0_g1_i1:208-942(-)